MQYGINFTFRNAVKVVKESRSWNVIPVNSDNIQPISIANFDESAIGEFTYQSILQQPSFQLIKMKYLFDRYIDGKIDNATTGRPSQIMYIVKVYQSERSYTETEFLSEIENNAVYYFVLNESDLPNEVRTASDEITLDGSWFNKFSWEN